VVYRLLLQEDFGSDLCLGVGGSDLVHMQVDGWAARVHLAVYEVWLTFGGAQSYRRFPGAFQIFYGKFGMDEAGHGSRRDGDGAECPVWAYHDGGRD
jgi:hypothetical protein